MKRNWFKSGLLLLVQGTLVLSVNTASAEPVPSINSVPTAQIRPGKMVWADLLTGDVKLAAEFYSNVFGWTITTSADSGYVTASLDGEPLAAIVAYEEDNTGEEGLWLTSVSVRDVDTSAEKVAQAGGKVLEPATDLPGRGRLAVVEDPDGAVLMLLRAEGGDPTDGGKVKPNSWVWAELWTDSPADAVGFYERVFAYRSVLIKGNTGDEHRVLGRDEVARASVVKTPFPDVEPNWLLYLLVDDVAAMSVKVIQHGGSVLLAPQKDDRNDDIAIVADPTGAVFALQHRRGDKS